MLDETSADRHARVVSVVETATQTSAQALARITNVRSAAQAIATEAANFSRQLQEMDGLSGSIETDNLLSGAGRTAIECAQSLDSLNTWELQALLQMSERRALEMKFISLMVKTDAATAATKSARASSFAEDLEKLANSARATTRDVTEAARPIGGKIKGARMSLQGCGDLLLRQSQTLEKQKRHCTTLLHERDAQMATFEAEAQSIAKVSGACIAELVPRLQFADAFSQRLHNTRRFLEEAEKSGQSARPEVLAMAAMQLKALAWDNALERNFVCTALTRLLKAAKAAQQVLSSSHADTGVQKWVMAMADTVGLTTSTIDMAHQQMRMAFDRIDDAFSATANVTTAIQAFEALVKKLHIEALNGAIAVNQSRASHSATYVLAAEVRSAATQCAENLKACTSELGAIDTSLSKIDRTAIEKELAALVSAQNNAKAAQEAQTLSLGAQAETRSNLADNVYAVIAACEDTLRSFARGAEMEAALVDLADDLSTNPFIYATADEIDWIWPFYTTQSERDIHSMLVGAPENAESDASAEDDDELDGFLF